LSIITIKGEILIKDIEEVNEAEIEIIKEIYQICEEKLYIADQTVPPRQNNYYNYDKEGLIIMLCFDFEVLNIGTDKIVRIGELVKELKNIIRFFINRTKDKINLEWLKELKNITYLAIRNSFLTTIPEFIKEFKNLEELEIGGNEVKLLPEWLPTLPKLKKLRTHTKRGYSSPLEFNQKNVEILRALHDKNVKVDDSIFRLHIELGLPEEIVKILLEIKNKHGRNVVYGQDPSDYYFEWHWRMVDFSVVDGNITEMTINEFQLKELPESFGKLNNLTKLSIIENELTSLPESFGELKELKELDLSENQLTSLPESFVNLTSLTKLNLSNNQFTEIPTQLWALKELTDLNLNKNPLIEEEVNVVKKVPDLIREYLRKKATIRVFISHAVIDFEPYRIGELQEYLEKQKEISQVFFCEEDLAGNIDEWMLDAVQKCQLILFIGTNKSVFHSVDCANELQLADKFSIPVIPIKGYDVDWPDLAEINLSRELGLEFDKENFDAFCEDLYKYIENFKQEINLMDKDSRQKGIIDIYERFRLMLDEKLDGLVRKIDENANKLKKIDEMANKLKKIDDLAERITRLESIKRE
jgi:Leucine-rich repeat (LRR) protein